MLYIKPFGELNKDDTPIAGGKGASLGEMLNAGIRVPDGFVVLADMFDVFLKETDLTQEIDAILADVNHEAIHTVEDASEKIQALILSRAMPEAIKKEIEEAFKKLDAEYVAVRSSATAEDGAEHAWAGQLESYLNTRGEHLLQKVQQCWASLFTPRAIFYRFEKGLHSTHISVAVVVQKMIQSEISGIAFSVHPVTEDYNQLIIEAGLGLGEAIVSGSVTPDSYVVEKSPRSILDINVSHQMRALYRESEKGGNIWKDLGGEGERQKLAEEQILELSDIIVRIENHYGFPCDIEWTYEGGKFSIVQSRPITTLSDKTSPPGKEIKNIIPLTRENTVFTFESTGTTFIFEDIVSRCYIQWESIRVAKRDNVRVFVKKEEVDRMHTEGGKMTRVFLQEKVESMQKWSKYTQNHLKELKSKDAFTKQEMVQFFEPLEEICKDYSFFDIHYSDGMLQDGTFSDAGEYVQSVKNVLRDVLSEPFFVKDGWLMSGLAILSKQFSLPVDTLVWYTVEDVKNLFAGKKVDDQIIEDRQLASVLYRDKKGTKMISLFGKEALKYFESFEDFTKNVSVIQGVVAHRGQGTVRGRVKIVKKDFSNPHYLLEVAKSVEENEILVTDTTDPDFLPIMQKVRAIVTDVGGMLSHASITSRELNKLCVIGTKFATKVLQSGDLIEVDADNGVVRILEKAEDLKVVSYQKLFQWPGEFSHFLSSYFMSVYNKHKAISLHDGNMWQSFLPHEIKEETLKHGLELYASEARYAELREGLIDGFKELAAHFEHVLAKDEITKKDVESLFEEALKHYNHYSQTEFFFTDLAYERMNNVSQIRKNFETFDELKLQGREYLNKIALAPGCYLDRLLTKIATQFGYEVNSLKCHSLNEILELFDGKPVASDELEKRPIYFMHGKETHTEVLTGESALQKIKDFFSELVGDQELKGQTANKGYYRGHARVFRFSLSEIDSMNTEIENMKKGEVLVADTTAPEIILACKKAGAIVTNQGGMMSHAAIVSRELNIPCVVGTGHATEIIKTGDLVEVDADNGLVRILEKN